MRREQFVLERSDNRGHSRQAHGSARLDVGGASWQSVTLTTRGCVGEWKMDGDRIQFLDIVKSIGDLILQKERFVF
jgi:hypothetical protein